MRFFGALFLGVCYANVAEKSEPVLTTLIPEVANPPKETQASVDARLALVAVCPEATSNCSVPTGQEAENEELADALDCMLKINITTISPGPCHDALKKFLDDHLNPPNRVPQGPMGPGSPTVLIMRPQPGPSPLADILQRMAANSRPMPHPMMFPFQDPRFQQQYPQDYMGSDHYSRGQYPQDYMGSDHYSRGQYPQDYMGSDHYSRGQYPQDYMGSDHYSRGQYPQDYMGSDHYSRGQSRAHGFPPMFSRGPMQGMERDYYEMRSHDRGRNRNSRNSGEEDGHWDYVWHSTRNEPRESRSGRGSHRMSSHRMPPPPHHMPPPPHRMPPPPHRMPPPPHRMPFPSRHMPSPPMSSRMSSPQRQVSLSSQRGSSRMSSSSSSMNSMMMMLLPRLMSQGSQNPMSGILMATLMKNMASDSYDYDYDYGYDYDDEALDDYDYDYDYEDEPASSPLASMIQKMLQQKLAARQATVQVSLDPTMIEPVRIVDDAPSPSEPLETTTTDPVEIQPSRARSDKEIRTEQVSYRSAP